MNWIGRPETPVRGSSLTVSTLATLVYSVYIDLGPRHLKTSLGAGRFRKKRDVYHARFPAESVIMFAVWPRFRRMQTCLHVHFSFAPYDLAHACCCVQAWSLADCHFRHFRLQTFRKYMCACRQLPAAGRQSSTLTKHVLIFTVLHASHGKWSEELSHRWGVALKLVISR